jgi:hypothetical protein
MTREKIHRSKQKLERKPNENKNNTSNPVSRKRVAVRTLFHIFSRVRKVTFSRWIRFSGHRIANEFNRSIGSVTVAKDQNHQMMTSDSNNQEITQKHTDHIPHHPTPPDPRPTPPPSHLHPLHMSFQNTEKNSLNLGL